MPASTTQDEYKIFRLDNVHINPSIMEGVFLNHSMLGPDTAVQINRFPPELVTQPFITGNPKIPNTMTCQSGVWIGSPQPYFTYQWYADDVLIEGATGKTFLTTEAQDGTFLTCAIVGTTPEGTDNGITDPFGVSLVQEQIVHTQEWTVITGLFRDYNQDHMSFKHNVVSGMWVDTRFDTMQNMGMAITGMENHTKEFVGGADVFMISTPTYEGQLTLTNPGAESGDLTGWTQDPANVQDIIVGTTSVSSGSYYFTGAYQGFGLTPGIKAYQDVVLSAPQIADTDAGLLFVQGEFLKASRDDQSKVGINLQFLDAGSALIETRSSSFMDDRDNFLWELDFLPMVKIPIGTRTVRVYMEIRKVAGDTFDGCIDDIELHLWKY